VLEKTPNQTVALHHLGLLLHQKGESKRGITFIEKAITHSSDFNQLNKLRLNLRSQIISSPLFDAERFSKHFEEALWAMWNKL